MLTREQAAQDLAEAHYSMDRSVRQIYRLVGDHEDAPQEPLKLLEVNADTLPAGIVPVALGAIPSQGIAFPVVVVEITPTEFEQLERGELPLPHGWRRDGALPRPALAGAA